MDGPHGGSVTPDFPVALPTAPRRPVEHQAPLPILAFFRVLEPVSACGITDSTLKRGFLVAAQQLSINGDFVVDLRLRLVADVRITAVHFCIAFTRHTAQMRAVLNHGNTLPQRLQMGSGLALGISCSSPRILLLHTIIQGVVNGAP